jgi:hypothetical protein
MDETYFPMPQVYLWRMCWVHFGWVETFLRNDPKFLLHGWNKRRIAKYFGASCEYTRKV